MKKKFVIVDGNSIFYREFYGLPITMRNSEGMTTNAIFGFAGTIIKILTDLKPDYMAIAFDIGKKTFRNNMFNGYKATRKPMPDELRVQVAPLREMLTTMGIKYVELSGFEGDDILGSLSKKYTGVEKIIITGDRDSFQLVDDETKVYLNKKGMTDIKIVDENALFEMYGVSPSEFVFVKALAGDTSDNIPGAKGVGEKTALSLVQKYKNLDSIYDNIEEIKGALKEKLVSSKEMVYLSFDLAKIKTDVKINLELEDFAVKFPFDNAVMQFFIKQGFKSLVNKSELFETNEQLSFSIVAREQVLPTEISSKKEIDELILTIKQTKEFGFVNFKGEYHISEGKKEYVIKGMPEDEMYLSLKSVFEDEDVKVILFDSKHERKNLKKYDINLNNFFDSMIAKHLVIGDKFVSFEGFISDPYELAEKPATILVQEFGVLLESLQEFNMYKLYFDLELPFSKLLFEMEERGFKFDKERALELRQVYKKEEQELIQQIYEVAGHEFNINSPKQLAEIIYDELALMKSKKRSTAIEVLEKLVDKHPLIPLVIRYRKVAKFLTNYIDGMIDCLDENNFIHTTFNQTLTTTGRLSSSEPNLQNIPIRGEESREIRSMFVASSEDNCLVDADYSQIELRILAHFTNDKSFINAFNSGRDIHTETATGIFNCLPEEVDSEKRRLAKVVNFGINYGMSEYGLAEDLGVSVVVAREYINNYYLAHPGVKEYMTNSIDEARRTGRVSTLLGRTRRMIDINSSNYMVRQSAERASQNMPIQGTASEVIKMAMLNIDKKLLDENLKAKLIMQVHDELIVDCPLIEKEKVEKIVSEEMKNAIKLSVNFEIDVKSAYRWSEGH